MSSSGQAARLAALSRSLREQWNLTRDHWSDAKALEFENRFLAELESAAHAAQTRMQILEATLHKLRNDCEPSAGT